MASSENTEERLRAAIADRYRIEREIGSGGMATVYLAQDLKHDRKVAVKVLRPELSASIGAERFLREIQISAKLNHPHILTLIDSGEADGLLYYVMPYVEGESLRDRLEREGQLSLEEAFKIVREVADGLGYAHRLDIVHRDIKPENVLLSEGHAVVADFGIAKAVSEAGGRVTKTGGSVGSPLYMSPEQAAGRGNLDGRSDLYSLACMLFEMLAGEPPFAGRDIQALIAKHAMEPPPDVRVLRASVPEPIGAVIKKALSKVPADRFRTVEEFTSILSGVASSGQPRADEDAAVGGPVEPVAVGPPRGALSRLSRSFQRWHFSLTAAAVLTVGALGIFAGLRLGGGAEVASEFIWEPGVQSVHQQITFSGGASSPALSPDGNLLAYLEGDNLFLSSVEGEARTLLATGALSLAWTPDGTRILFTQQVAGERTLGLYSIQLPGGAPRWVRNLGDRFSDNFAVSPDGRRVAWAIPVEGRYGDSILVLSRDLGGDSGTDTLTVLAGHPIGSRLVWSPEGTRILFIDGFPLYRHQVFSIFGGTSTPILTDEDLIQDAVWSPDGNGLMYVTESGELRWLGSDEVGNTGRPIQSFSGRGLREISVSSDGRRLGYLVETGWDGFLAAPILDDGVIGEVYQITPRTFPADEGVFSPDGAEFAFVRGGSGNSSQDIYLVSTPARGQSIPAGGGEPRRITFLNQSINDLRWSGDGSTIAFLTWDSKQFYRIMSVPAGGGPVEPVVSLGTEYGQGFHNGGPSFRLTLSYRGDTVFYQTPEGYRWSDGQDSGVFPWHGERGDPVNFLNFHLAPFSPVGAETYRYEPGRFIATSVVDGSERTVVEFDETALPGALQASYGCLETDEGWVYFVTGGDEADGYRYRIWKVRKAGGIPEPAVFRSDRTPMAFVSPFEKFPLSPDGSHVAWGYGEVYRDVWIAEVVHPDPTAR